MRILVVDDDLFILEMIRLMLQDRFEILTASDGQRGLEIARTDKIDLVILDWMMPGTDGLSVLVTMKSDESTRDIPVVFLTGKTGQSDINRAYAHGAAGYIVKPFKKSDLLEKINAILGTEN